MSTSPSHKKHLHKKLRNLFLTTCTSSSTLPTSSHITKRTLNLITKTYGLIEKENLYLSTKKEIKHLTTLNTQYNSYLSLMKTVTSKWSTNHRKAETMKDRLKEKFKAFSVIVDKYDNKLKVFNHEKEELIKVNEGIIKHKQEQQKKLNAQLNELNNKTKKQKSHIDTLVKRIKELNVYKEKEYKMLQQKEQNDKKDIERLKRKYMALKKKEEKYYDDNKKEDVYNMKLLKDEEYSQRMLHKENKEIELFEMKMRNEILTMKYKEISMTISERNTIDDIDNNNNNNTHHRSCSHASCCACNWKRNSVL